MHLVALLLIVAGLLGLMLSMDNPFYRIEIDYGGEKPSGSLEQDFLTWVSKTSRPELFRALLKHVQWIALTMLYAIVLVPAAVVFAQTQDIGNQLWLPIIETFMVIEWFMIAIALLVDRYPARKIEHPNRFWKFLDIASLAIPAVWMLYLAYVLL